MPTRPSIRTALFVSAILLASTTLTRANVVFTEEDFTPSEWLVTVISSSGGATHAESQLLTGGNPAEYRRMSHTLPAGSSIVMLHHFIGATYHPWIDGPVAAIDFREDRTQFSPPAPTAVGARWVIVQDGIHYVGPIVDFTNTSWGSAQIVGLKAADFTSPTNTHPDFSVCGGPLQFGIVRSSANAGGTTYAVEHGLDNFTVTVRHTLTGVGSTGAAPASMRVLSANPFARAVTLELVPGRIGHTDVGIYDVSGRLVRTLEDRELWGEITHSHWDATDDAGRAMPSGVYFAHMRIGDAAVQRKLILVR